ncbi:hypothetical protein QA612_08070 [Evansella sp. AB-P1]|uniref:hypothetical protein n=1 Tax=Evansella sp. AB-P1 TaxID=3037653 RepID=UPI00242006AE|nr:hypothetical protein [Evansella sp. AB-P1]MDG5787449.1 hypothetical protein [Evansella sp. AB-P1]
MREIEPGEKEAGTAKAGTKTPGSIHEHEGVSIFIFHGVNSQLHVRSILVTKEDSLLFTQSEEKKFCGNIEGRQ